MKWYLVPVFIFTISHSNNAQKALVDSIRQVSTYNSREELAEIFRQNGIAFKNVGAYNKAEQCYNESLAISKELGDSTSIGTVLNSLALFYAKSGENADALKFFYRAIEVNKRIHNRKGLTNNYLNLGNFFFLQKNFGQSLKYFFLCKEQLEKGNSRTLASIHVGIGNILTDDDYEFNNREIAQDEYSSALVIYQQLGDSLNTSKVYNNLGRISYLKGKYDDAIDYYNKGIIIKENLKDRKGILIACLNIGNALHKRKEYAESLTYYKRGKQIAEELKDAVNYLHIISNIVNVHIALGDVDLANQLFEEYNELRDSVFNEEKSRQLSELQTLYETEKTAQELSLQKTATAEKAAQNRILVIVVISLTLLAIAVVVLFLQRQRAVKHLRVKEEELHKQEVSRLQKEQDIQSLHAMMEGQDQERKRIAEDLHDRLGAKLSAIKAFHESEQSTGNKFKKVDEMLNETISETREIAHNLAPSALTKYGLVQALKELLDTLQATNKLSTQFSFTNLEQRLPEAIETALYYIVQELITNTLRHSEADSMSITLALHEDGGLNLCYEDNGKGFDMASLPKDSMGLRNMRTRLAPFSGLLSIDSSPNHGVTFIIDISLQELTA